MATRFLISTTHHLLAADPEEQLIWRVHSGHGLYFGLAVGPDGSLYVACRNTAGRPDAEGARSSERASVLVLNRDFQVSDELHPPFAMRDVHGIACIDHRLWVTCSFDNMVAIYDLRSGEWTVWHPAPNPADRGRDVHHFNTVRLIGRQICLVAHCFGPSYLLFYDYPTLQLESSIQLGVQAHDVFSFNGAFATCSSAERWITNTRGERLRTGNFPRGSSLTDQGNLLGISMNAARPDRSAQSGILRWYSSDWCFRSDYVLPGVGMVLDILHLNGDGYSWGSLEAWPSAQVCRGAYNSLAPGNVYTSDMIGSHQSSGKLDWHAPEVEHVWTAARVASVPILINPNENVICVEVSSAFPSTYSVEIWLNDEPLGTVNFLEPGVQRAAFPVPSGVGASGRLSFRVPQLWRPAEHIPQSHDERLLGIALHSIVLSAD